jgi:hypothetical protein
MSLLSQTIAQAALADHEINMFYEIDGLHALIGPDVLLAPELDLRRPLRMEDLVAGDGRGVPDDQKPALQGRYAKHAVWSTISREDGQTDFHQHVHDVVSGTRRNLLALYKPEQYARRLLDRADLYTDAVDRKQRIAKSMRLTFSQAAQGRLREHGLTPRPLRVVVEDLTLALFETKLGFAQAVIQLEPFGKEKVSAPLAALELLEAQVALGRFNEIEWCSTKDGTPVDGGQFTLGELVRNLALGATTVTRKSGRVSTYAYVQFEASQLATEVDQYATQLARHYTTDYLTSPDIGGVRRVGDFLTVRHAVAAEGAASIVSSVPTGGTLPPFLKSFRTATLRRHYVPIALLALHEQSFLVAQTSNALIDGDPQTEPNLEKLSTLVRDSLLFRLRFRFSSLSYISMHNALYAAFRSVLDLDRMMGELSASVTEAEILLRQAHAANRDHRFFWGDRIGVIALGGFTAFAIAKELVEVLTRNKENAGWSGLAAFVVVVVGIIAYLKWRGPVPSHGGHFQHHSAIHEVIDRATKAD